MFKRLLQVESAIRDSKISKIEFQFEHFTDSSYSENCIKISFNKSDKEYIELTLLNPQAIALLDKNFDSHYIDLIKVFKSENGFEISLNPYDERIEGVQDEDNYIFKSLDFKIQTTKI